MNGETLELESGDKVTIAHADGVRATITVQSGGSVAVAHLTPGEAMHFSSTVCEMAVHLAPTAFEQAVSSADEIERFRKALDEARYELSETESLMAQAKREHETAIASLVAELEAAKAHVVGYRDADETEAVHAQTGDGPPPPPSAA